MSLKMGSLPNSNNKMVTKLVEEKDEQKMVALHIVMYPFYGISHLTSFLRLSNKLAQRGHKISFILPIHNLAQLTPHNHFPNLISFFPITLPSVAAPNEPFRPSHHWDAMDLSSHLLDSLLAQLKPNFVFFDFAQWVPPLAHKHGAKSIYYATSTLLRYAYLTPELGWANATDFSYDQLPALQARLMKPPSGFPCPEMVFQPGEVRAWACPFSPALLQIIIRKGGLSFFQRIAIAFRDCDAFASKTCREMEGPFCDFLEKQLGKPVLLAGPLVPKPPDSVLDPRFDSWLNGFEAGSVVFCALGSQCVLPKDRLHQLLLGLELTGRPFLVAIKPPNECETMESALPEGFLERIKDRGIVQDGWVQQPLILQHPSVGCFVTHSGAGSLAEAIVSNCQLVLLPQATDQFINAKLMSKYLKIGIEVEKREDDCYFTKDDVCKAIQMAMDVENGVGKEVSDNFKKWREILLKDGLEDSYIDQFICGLQNLLSE